MRSETSEPEQAGEDRDEQRDLQGERSSLGVDPDHLGLHVGRLADEQGVERRVGHDLGVVLERIGDEDLLLPASAPCSTPRGW